MKQYIDKAAVVAEIESLRRTTFTNFDEGVNATVQTLLEVVDTLEVKEVEEEPVNNDLEEASKKWLRPQLDKSYANYGEVKMMELTHFDGYAMLDAIEFGAQWQKEQMITKACEWLREHKDYVANEDNGISGWIPECFIESFKKAMEE